ncbi:MAG TPA: DUF167 domain-containing protein [Candidatus Nanoarchaeia archaeon]|nr:DUF167 domain-containing protein [Candidatus Nanoarchaeia archaeon]
MRKISDEKDIPALRERFFAVRVRTKANQTRIKGWDESRKAVLIDIAAAPEDGKANKELIKHLSRLLGKRAAIMSGQRCRDKIIQVED